jgi:hypothetical protein
MSRESCSEHNQFLMGPAWQMVRYLKMSGYLEFFLAENTITCHLEKKITAE